MVYSLDILNSTNTTFDVLNAPPAESNKMVSIYYNGSGLHDISGPTPYIDISTSVERNSLGMPEVYNTKITLNGTIVRTGSDSSMTSYGSGIGPVVSGIKGLQTIFSGDAGILEVFCKSGPSSIPLIAWTGVRVVSLDFPKSDDNWVFTADYSIVLEHLSSAVSGFSVKSLNDTWNIEPLEDFLYTKTKVNVLQKQEYHNPELKPQAATENAPQPQGTQTQNNQGATATANVDLDIISIPQYKISRTVSAVGIPTGTGQLSYNSAYLHARKWVEYRLSQSFNDNSSGIIRFGDTNTTSPLPVSNPIAVLKGNGYLYNYLRTTNFSITEGSYEVTETYLAMPTGIGYSEDYTVDMSTDDRYIHTVRVQGEIRGLSLAPLSLMSGESLPLVSGVGPRQIYANIDLTEATGQFGGRPTSTPNILDNILQPSKNTDIHKNKYDNAASGWLYDIKPYLYRRACLAMNSKDRNRGYILPTTQPMKPPANPTYSTHGALNIIPISTSETHNPRKGSISYSYEYTNKFTMISGVIFENISMEDNAPTDVINEAFVLGRSLGPVLQSLGTKTSSRKQISIEVGVVPPSSLNGFFVQNQECPLFTGGTVYQTITGIIEGFKPFGDRNADIFGNAFRRVGMEGQVYVSSDNQSWNPNDGRYSRTVSWIYQQCTNAKNYLDH